jgi:hypothetical protein
LLADLLSFFAAANIGLAGLSHSTDGLRDRSFAGRNKFL